MKVQCSGEGFTCPCFINDHEYGFDCSLDWAVKDGRTKGGRWNPTSDDCGLVRVVYMENGEERVFEPKRIDE